MEAFAQSCLATTGQLPQDQYMHPSGPLGSGYAPSSTIPGPYVSVSGGAPFLPVQDNDPQKKKQVRASQVWHSNDAI